MKRFEWVLSSDGVVSAAEATIHLGVGISVNGYMLSDGQIRYSLEYVSVLLGYAENYFSRLTKQSRRKWRALQDKGFTAYLIPVKASRAIGGATTAKTIGFDDFCLLVEYEAEIQNPKAVALLTASFRELLRSRTQDAFGLPADSLSQKLVDFDLSYQAYLERDAFLREDREDLYDLWLPGDDLYYLEYKDWEDIEPWETVSSQMAKSSDKRKKSQKSFGKTVTGSSFGESQSLSPMSKSQTPQFHRGQLIPLHFKDRQLTAIVIDPDGLGEGRPTVGLGFGGMDRHTGVPKQTLSDRVSEIDGVKYLELPSGKRFRVSEILGEDNNEYSVIEATDWVELARDWAKDPGKLRKPAKDGLIDFLAWFAAEGVYAQAYTFLKRTYTRQDDEVLRQWLLSRESGKPYRKDWGWEIKEKDPQGRYAYWTNHVYRGLFGMDASEMKQVWENPVSGSRKIARNYIPQAIGLEAVAYCEKMVAQVDFDDLYEAHEEAIRITKVKFAKYFSA